MEHHVYDMAQTPMAFRRDANLLPSRGLVRMSANWFSVGMNERETTSDSTRSRKEVMSDVDVLGPRVLNRILGNIDSTSIIIVS
jgi:hypothetical protein